MDHKFRFRLLLIIFFSVEIVFSILNIERMRERSNHFEEINKQLNQSIESMKETQKKLEEVDRGYKELNKQMLR